MRWIAGGEAGLADNGAVGHDGKGIGHTRGDEAREVTGVLPQVLVVLQNVVVHGEGDGGRQANGEDFSQGSRNNARPVAEEPVLPVDGGEAGQDVAVGVLAADEGRHRPDGHDVNRLCDDQYRQSLGDLLDRLFDRLFFSLFLSQVFVILVLV